MRRSGLFPLRLLSFIVIVLFAAPDLSASVTFWDDFSSASNGDDNSIYHREDNSRMPILDPDEFNIYKILPNNDSMQLYWKPGGTHAHVLRDMLISKTILFVPDELLSRQIVSKTLNSGRPFELHSDMRHASKPADDIVFKNNTDYTRTMRTPAPGSLLLVALGLLSLRFTRRLRY